MWIIGKRINLTIPLSAVDLATIEAIGGLKK